jgi:hypothetical protein
MRFQREIRQRFDEQEERLFFGGGRGGTGSARKAGWRGLAKAKAGFGVRVHTAQVRERPRLHPGGASSDQWLVEDGLLAGGALDETEQAEFVDAATNAFGVPVNG